MQSTAKVTAVFANVDKWITAVFVDGKRIKRKIKGKDQLKTHAKTNGPHRE